MRVATARFADTPIARALAREVALGDDGKAPEWIELIPPGALQARDGRRWTHADPNAVLAATRERAGTVDLVIDYEHQTDYSIENGQPAPAAGWVRELAVRAGALWGRVEWTARATAAIEAKEYRYISPTFAYDKQSLEVRGLLRAALTNSPAFDMPALARDKGDVMTPEQLVALAAALGLTETATADEIVAKAKAFAKSVLGPIATALGLTDTATTDEIVAKAKAATASPELGPIATALGLTETATADEIVAKAKTRAAPADLGQFVPRPEFDRVAAALATLQSERTEERVDKAVGDAITAGKIAPAQRDWALGYARSDEAGFAAYVAAAPVIIAPSRTGPRPPAPPNAALTADEVAVCKALGITAEQFKKSRDELDGRDAQ